jgi:hypothetical protein
MKKYFLIASFIIPFLVENTCNADDLRLDFSIGAGILIAGDKHATGGFALAPSLLVGKSITDAGTVGLSYQNMILFNTFRSIQNIGVYDQNSFMLTLSPSDKVNFDFGPSLDLFSMVLCNNEDLCSRQSGIAPGVHLRFSISNDTKFGFVINTHGSWIPSPYYNGPILSVAVGPAWRL